MLGKVYTKNQIDSYTSSVSSVSSVNAANVGKRENSPAVISIHDLQRKSSDEPPFIANKNSPYRSEEMNQLEHEHSSLFYSIRNETLSSYIGHQNDKQNTQKKVNAAQEKRRGPKKGNEKNFRREQAQLEKREKELSSEEMMNEDRLKRLEECQKSYVNSLISRKKILRKIQNINIKNNLVSFDKIFISKLEINEIKLIINIKNQNLSYDEKNQAVESDAINALIILIMNIPNISDAHLQFNKKMKKNVCGSLQVLMFDEMSDYVTSGINQMFYVLGAVDFIGNPLMIYKHWKKGYVNFIEDVKKSIDSLSFPLLFGILLLNAIGKFGKTILSGVLEGVSRMCGSWSNCFQRFSRNTDNYSIVANSNFLQYEILDQPSNCAEGFFYGCQSFFTIITISSINILYKPFAAIRNKKELAKYEKKKVKKFLAIFKGICSGIISGISSFVFGLFNSVFSLFTFLFIGTLNQIQSLTSKSVIRPKKISIIKEYSKFVDYEYPFSFSQQIIREKKKKKELLKKNIIAVVLLYTIRKNVSDQVKNFLWISSKELGYCEKNKLMWTLSISCIVKIDITLIQLVNEKATSASEHYQYKKKSIFKSKQYKKNQSLKKRKTKKIPSEKITTDTKIEKPINLMPTNNVSKFRWTSRFAPRKFRHFSDFKPSYYIRIVHKSLYRTRRKEGRRGVPPKPCHIFYKRNSHTYNMRKILKKSTFEKYFENKFQEEYVSYENQHMEELKRLKKVQEKNELQKQKEDKKKKTYNTISEGKQKPQELDEQISTETNENMENVEKKVMKEYNRRRKNSKQYLKGREYLQTTQTLREDDLSLKNYDAKSDKKKGSKVRENNRKINKIKNGQYNQRDKLFRKMNKYMYISKLVKCESKEVALHVFSVLMSFLLHQSPYYINKIN